MEKQWKEFSENIRLTKDQENDAKTKYDGVCTKLHTSYYDTDYDGNTKFLFGSYRTKTNVRPLTEKQDVDVIFKIPQETYEKFKNYESNGPAALLQEIRGYLKEKYTTTDKIKAWGKVVLVNFAENTHNVEVLPAYEKDDKTFVIPNSENGGSWDNNFDPRFQINEFQASNESTDGMTAELVRMIKTWVNNTLTCEYKSFELLNDVLRFFKRNFKNGATYTEYSAVVTGFFQFLKEMCDDNIESHVLTALNRAEKACNFEKDGKPKEASEEWRKIFGTEFPLIKSNPTEEKCTRVFTNPSAPYGEDVARLSTKEENISNILNPNYSDDNEVVRLSDSDVVFLQQKYSLLHYDVKKNVIRGKLRFDVQYCGLESIADEFQIEIDLNRVKHGVPVVKEIGGKILSIAAQKMLKPIDLHLDSNSGAMCIIIPPEVKERYPQGFDLKELLKHIEEHLYWVSYFEKYGKAPWEAYGHGEIGYFELFRKNKIKYLNDFKNHFKCSSRQEVRRIYRELERKYNK